MAASATGPVAAPLSSWRDDVMRRCGADLEALATTAVEQRAAMLQKIERRCGGTGLVLAAERASSFFERKLVFERLRKLNDPQAAGALAAYLAGKPSPHWAAEAAFALAELGDLRAVPYLADHLRKDPIALYSEAAEPEEKALARTDIERVVAVRLLADLAAIHTERVAEIRAQAADAVREWISNAPAPHANAMRFLAATKSSADLPTLRDWAFPQAPLPSPGQQPPFPQEWATAQSALRYLGAVRDEPSWDALVRQLGRRKSDAGDVDVSTDALLQGGVAMTGMALRAISVGASDGLAEWRDERAFTPLLNFLEDPKQHEQARNQACRALAWVMPDSRINEVAHRVRKLAAGRSQRYDFTAVCLVGGLSYRPIPRMNPVLIELVAPATQEHLRLAAAVALGRNGLTEAEARQLMVRRGPKVQQEVAIALVMGGDLASARASVAGFGSSGLEVLQSMIRDSIEYVSEEDLRGLLPRLARNAENLGLRGVMRAPRFDAGPHSLTGVVLRYRLRNMGGEDARRVLQMMMVEDETAPDPGNRRRPMAP